MKILTKEVAGFNGIYTIDNKGRVWSQHSSRYLRPTKGLGNYRYVMLSDNRKAKRFSVHRLIATHFIPNPDSKPCVNHIDGNTANNSIDNLEWVTHSENTKHAIRTGLMDNAIAKGRKYTRLSVDQIKEIRTLKGLRTQQEIADKFNVHRSYVLKILNGKARVHE